MSDLSKWLSLDRHPDVLAAINSAGEAAAVAAGIPQSDIDALKSLGDVKTGKGLVGAFIQEEIEAHRQTIVNRIDDVLTRVSGVSPELAHAMRVAVNPVADAALTTLETAAESALS